MEPSAVTEIGRFYADYGAMAVLVIVNVGTSFMLFRYFSAELKTAKEAREQSERDWRQRYDTIIERMLAQVVSQGQILERMADKIREK